MATHSRVLAWRIPWTEELGSYSQWSRKSRLDLATQPPPPALQTFVFRSKFDFWIQPVPFPVVWPWVPLRLLFAHMKHWWRGVPDSWRWWKGQPTPLPTPRFPNGGVGASGAEFVYEVCKKFSLSLVTGKFSPEWTLTLSPSFKVEEMEGSEMSFLWGWGSRFAWISQMDLAGCRQAWGHGHIIEIRLW